MSAARPARQLSYADLLNELSTTKLLLAAAQTEKKVCTPVEGAARPLALVRSPPLPTHQLRF